MEPNSFTRELHKNDTAFKLGGFASLVVGLIFFIPGVRFTHKTILGLFSEKFEIEPALIFIATFPVTIGAILLLMSINLFTGKISEEKISTPILKFSVIIFILGEILMTLMMFVLRLSEINLRLLYGYFFNIIMIISIISLIIQRNKQPRK